jgi:transcriptional regulator with XRE-family HTH domain
MALIKIVSKEIGNNIRKIRQDLGLSQEQFGVAVGAAIERKFPSTRKRKEGKSKEQFYSQDSVAKWESGQVPHAAVLVEIANMAHCTVDSILGRSDIPSKDIKALIMDVRRNINRIEELGTPSKPGERHGKKK